MKEYLILSKPKKSETLTVLNKFPDKTDSIKFLREYLETRKGSLSKKESGSYQEPISKLTVRVWVEARR